MRNHLPIAEADFWAVGNDYSEYVFPFVLYLQTFTLPEVPNTEIAAGVAMGAWLSNTKIAASMRVPPDNVTPPTGTPAGLTTDPSA